MTDALSRYHHLSSCLLAHRKTHTEPIQLMIFKGTKIATGNSSVYDISDYTSMQIQCRRNDIFIMSNDKEIWNSPIGS